MQRCSERAFTMCPARHLCGTIHEATFLDNSDCAEFNRKVESMPMTNADWIRSMTEKELVEFIGHNSLCDRVQGESGNWCNDHNCADCLEEWLKQPAEVSP